MKNKDSWDSEFRKKRFYERQNLKREKKFLENYYNDNLFFKTKKTIAVLLDLDGTSDFLDDEKAKVFVRQLEFIRKKFGAELGTISISTHFHDSSKMESVLDILARNLSNNIKIGINFYYGGIYDYDKKVNIPQEYNFNQNKMHTFDQYYIHNISLSNIILSNQWFAVIDDGISEDVYKEYQNNHPMLLCRPSQREDKLTTNNFMSIATTTKGFDGVIEVLDCYINSIRNLLPEQILEKQQAMLTHISSFELTTKIEKRDYAFIERYFMEGYADESDYNDTLFWLGYTYLDQVPSREELSHLKNILQLLAQRFQYGEEKSKDMVRKLQLEVEQMLK